MLETALDGPISATDSTFNVLVVAGTPAVPFVVYIENETIIVMSESGGTYTAVRGAKGSTAAAHANGAAVYYARQPEVLGSSFEAIGSVAAHVGAADPHTVYQKESEKNVGNGYPGLDGSSKLTGSQQVYGAAANTACEGNDARLSGGSGITELTGDVTAGPGSGAQAATIPNNTVINAKAADMATKTYKGRTSAGTGDPEDVAVATLKTDLVLVKGDVGLGSVDNTTDAGKPVSTAQQTALDLKAPLASPTFTGTVTLPAATVTLAMQANMATVSLVYRKTAGSGVPEVNTLATVKTDLALVKGDVGLGSVDNTADSAKPVSTAQQTALDLKSDTSHNHDAAYEVIGAVATHAAAADPHTGYQKESEKAVSDGYASLDAGAKVPVAQLATGTPDGTKFMRDDRSWVTPTAGASETNPNLYVTAADYNLTASRSLYFPAEYEIGNGFVTDLAASSIMEIG